MTKYDRLIEVVIEDVGPRFNYCEKIGLGS